jgi:transcriptional regulator of acetoin/glycerol metabolism
LTDRPCRSGHHASDSAAAAQRIENIYFAHRHADTSIERLSHYRDFADSAAEARLALADNGTIIEAGSNAARLLASDGATLGGVDVSLRSLLGAHGPLEIKSDRGEPLRIHSYRCDSTCSVDVAVVSTTLHDLSQRVRAGQLGEDLFFRLSGVTVTLRALRHLRDRAARICHLTS